MLFALKRGIFQCVTESGGMVRARHQVPLPAAQIEEWHFKMG